MGEQCIQELPEERQGKLLEGNDEHVRKSKPINSLHVDLGLPGPEHSSDRLSDWGFYNYTSTTGTSTSADQPFA